MHLSRLRRPYLWLMAIFAVSRALYFAAGIRFDTRTINIFWQNADPVLLKTRLLETLYYLHIQPPLFNLMIGVVLKLFPEHFGVALNIVYLCFGVILCISLYRLMLVMGVRPSIALLGTALFMSSPGVVLFENMLVYEYPLTALLAASAVVFHRLLTRPTPWVAASFFSLLAILVLMRAVFHLGWLVAIAAFTIWLLKDHRKMLVKQLVTPLALCLAFYLKNLIVFGFFGPSSWMGFNAFTITVGMLRPEELQHLLEAKILAPISGVNAYLPVTEFQRFVPLRPPTGIPALDQVYDSTGRVNHNNITYFDLFPYFKAEAMKILLQYPKAYRRSMFEALYSYFFPTGDSHFFDQNRVRILTFDRWFNRIFFLQWNDWEIRSHIRGRIFYGTGILLVVGLPFLFLWGCLRLWKEAHGGAWQPQTALLAFMLFNIAFISAIVNLLSTDENNRYRLPLDPFYATLLAMFLTHVYRQRLPAPAPAEE